MLLSERLPVSRVRENRKHGLKGGLVETHPKGGGSRIYPCAVGCESHCSPVFWLQAP